MGSGEETQRFKPSVLPDDVTGGAGAGLVTRRPGDGLGLTERQWQIAALMAQDLVDAVIAARLDVSVRTVRSEIAAILRALDVSSRFGAGIALGRALQQAETGVRDHRLDRR